MEIKEKKGKFAGKHTIWKWTESGRETKNRLGTKMRGRNGRSIKRHSGRYDGANQVNERSHLSIVMAPLLVFSRPPVNIKSICYKTLSDCIKIEEAKYYVAHRMDKSPFPIP